MQVMVLADGTTMALVHWTYLDARWRIACAPHVEPDGNWQRTDDPRAVNCPHCRETARWHEAANRATAIAGWPWVHWLDGGKVACSFTANDQRHRTDDPRAASCPFCRAADGWKKAVALLPPLPGR